MQTSTFRLSEDGESQATDFSFAQPLTVQSVGTHVYFYAPVNSDRCLALMQEIRYIDCTLRAERISRSLPDGFPKVPIWLHIHSYGGSLFDGFGIANQLQTIETPIYSIVEGCCASAGTLISMACARRLIMPSAFVLIHQLSGFSWGTFEQFKDEMHIMGMAMQELTKFYTAHSNLSDEQVKGILQRDSWYNAQECLDNGFVDEIMK